MSIHFPDIPATFRNIPRTSTTSFRHWVTDHIQTKEILFDDKNPMMMPCLTMNQIQERWVNFGTTFAFVRNPFDRLVSIFHFVGQTAKLRIEQRCNYLKLDSLKINPFEADLKILFQYQKGFDNWIKSSLNEDSSTSYLQLFNRKNTETQMYFLNHIVPDIVVHLENYNTEFCQIQDLLGCHAPPIHINTSVHKEYRTYYTDLTRVIATKWLEEDLDTFGYVF